MKNPIEPWLRGPVPGLDPVLGAVLHAFQHAREELAECSEGLTAEQIWSRPGGVAALGFHIRHVGGAAERLATYATGQQLSERQTGEMRCEVDPGASREELLAELERRLGWCESAIRGIDPATLAEPRGVGRKQLPTTVAGLLVHIAEHAMRHTGQAVTTAMLIRGT